MRKKIKQAIGFFMAVCLMAGNSYIDMGTSAVTMTDWIEVAKDSEEENKIKEPLLLESLQEYCDTTVRKASAATSAETSDGRFVFYNPDETNKIIETGQTIKITNSTTFFLTKVDDDDKIVGFDENVKITSVHTDDKIAKVETRQDDEQGYSGYNVTITAIAPGATAIQVVVNDKGVNYTFTCNVEVQLTIDTSEINWESVSNEKVLVFKDAKDYQLKLKNVENKNVNGNLMAWEWRNDGVIVVDEATGIISPKGAGVTTVELKTLTGNMSEKFTVIVAPTGSTTQDGKYTSEINIPATPQESFVSESFTLFTNGKPAANMTWEIYAITYDGTKKKETKITQKDTSLMTYEISTTDGNIYFSGVKAGTYRVTGYSSSDKKYADKAWNKVQFNIVVGVNLKDTVKYMNIGDSYSILDNCNIPANRFIDLIGIEYKDNVNGRLYASLDTNTGVVKTLNNGTVEFLVKYKSTSSASIYAPGDFVNRDKEVTYTFHIIDAISLNVTNISMYTGTTYQLVANVTDRTVPVTWKSTDTSLATVDANGLVTAKKATGTKAVQIIASQVVDGVEKSIACNIIIQPAVTQINLSHSSIELPMGDYEVIKATVKPEGIEGTKLTWMSSDTSIFEIIDKTELTATILAKSGGTAVLTALNAENVIVAHCKVIVLQAAEGIKLSETSKTVNLADKTYQLYAELTPANTTNSNLIWASQNTALATVDSKGKVTFKGSGTVTISVQSEDNPALIAYCIFNIRSAVSGVSLDEHVVELYTGGTKRLSYTVLPTSATNKNVHWTSFNTSIVTVDDTGMLVAKGPGTTQVMVMTEESSYYDLCTVTVKQEATGVKMTYTNISLNVGQFFDMKVTVTPANSTESSLIWESLNPSIATVSTTGRITARASGTTTVMVKTQNGVTSFCTVTILDPVLSLELDPTEIVLDIDETFVIDPVFKPTKPSNMEVVWSSSNEDVAEIDEDGEVYALSGGTSVITCESVDGGYRAFCLVTVIEPVIEITISPETYRLGVGKTYALTATISNHGTATNTEIEWSSSDDSICEVDENGKITGIDYGYATIYAEAADGSGAFATCEVRVIREVTSIKLNHTTLSILQGETISLKSTIQPSNASYQTAIFSSSDESVAIVDEDGVLTALNAGSVIIRAEARDNSGKYAICYVTVTTPVASTGVTVSDKEIVLAPGEKKQVTISMKPYNTTDTKMWTSNNQAVASVDSSGTITAHTTGSATITVMTSSGKTATVNVTVLGLSRTSIEIPIYTKFSKLTVDGAVGTVRWEVDDPTICEVNNGVITARKIGTTKVTATINGRTLSCKVKVVR